MLLAIGKFFKEYIGYIILIGIIIFITYRLFSKTESERILKNDLKDIKFEKDSLISIEQSYKVTVDLLKEKNVKVQLQKAILLSKFNKLNKDINDKIKEDEDKISDIDNLTSEDVDFILANYKFTALKTKD